MSGLKIGDLTAVKAVVSYLRFLDTTGDHTGAGKLADDLLDALASAPSPRTSLPQERLNLRFIVSMLDSGQVAIARKQLIEWIAAAPKVEAR